MIFRVVKYLKRNYVLEMHRKNRWIHKVSLCILNEVSKEHNKSRPERMTCFCAFHQVNAKKEKCRIEKWAKSEERKWLRQRPVNNSVFVWRMKQSTGNWSAITDGTETQTFILHKLSDKQFINLKYASNVLRIYVSKYDHDSMHCISWSEM